MTDHAPDDRFLEHLEWQMQTSLRRRDRFARPTHRPSLALVRSAVLAVACLLCGAGVVIGAERLQQSRDREFLLAQNEIRVMMARGRLETSIEAHEQTLALQSAALITESEVCTSELAVRELEHELVGLQLDREEIELSGREPDTRLNAPLVRRRDFVSERLRLTVERERSRLELDMRSLERTRALVETGMVSARELAGEEAVLGMRVVELERSEGLIALRADFLAGRIDERRLLLLELRGGAEARVEQAQLQLRRAQEQLDYAQRLEEAGMGARASKRHELEVLLHEGELALAQLELEMIDEKLAQ